MTEPTLPDPSLDNSQGQDSGTGGDAPWASYIQDLPESIRPLVEPKFKEWDSNFTKKVQQVHSEYEPLKPFKTLVDEGYDFDSVQQAIQFAQLVNEDPQRVYEALVEQYGYGKGEQGHVEPNADDPDEDSAALPPEMQKYVEMTEQMAQIMVSQQQAEEMAREEAALDAQLAALKEQHGDFDEDFVMAKVYAGATWEQAIDAFNALGQRFQAPSAPVVMGSGGGLPSQAINPAQMSEKDRKALVAQFAAQANK